MHYSYYFTVVFILLCIFGICVCAIGINLIEKNKLTKDELKPMLEIYGTTEKIINALNRMANVNAFLIIISIVSINIYF